MQKSKPKLLVSIIFLSTLAIGIIGGFIGGYLEDELYRVQSTGISVQPTSPVATPASSTTTNLESLIKQTMPGVVNITDTAQTTNVFGQARTVEAVGTGMILTKDGYVLTNKHVVSNDPNNVVVEVSDSQQYPAKIVALSSDNDLAILKINITNLTPVRIGDSSLVVLGQPVIAIGNTLGQFQNTVTEGIISGLNRTILAGDSSFIQEQLSGLLQTDAAINPGNSGGPLIDQQSGTVIGINTATSTNAQNIGLVIPINQAKTLINNTIPAKSL